jgi:hypothetical protein
MASDVCERGNEELVNYLRVHVERCHHAECVVCRETRAVIAEVEFRMAAWVREKEARNDA